jgi:hypothetical protein
MAIAKNKPALAPLAMELREKGISAEWFKGYRELPNKRRKILLQAFLGQPYIISNPDEQYGSSQSYLRLMDAICARVPQLVDTPLYQWVFPKEAIPRPVAAIFGFSGSLSGPRVLRDLLFQKTVRPACIVRRHRHYQALARQCQFNRTAAQLYFLSDIEQSKGFTRYFQSMVDEVWAPNMIRYLYFFLDYFMRGKLGKPQKKIPMSVSERLGIPLFSVPDLLLSIDVLYLGVNGALDLDELRAEHHNLAVLVDYLARPAFRSMRRAFSTIGHLTPEQSCVLHRRRQNAVRRSTFITSFLFNLHHLFEGNKLRSKGLYRFVRMESFRRQVLAHFSRYEPDVKERIRRVYAYRADLDDSLDLRSFVNILVYLDTLADKRLLSIQPDGGTDYMAALPSVAKFQFGVSPPHKQDGGKKLSRRSIGLRKRHNYYARENKLIGKLVDELQRG